MTSRTRSSAVSTAEIQRLDTDTIDTVGIPRLLLMEHAGLALAHVAHRIFLQTRRSAPAMRASEIVVCAGSGYNGGDGLCAAWHLAHLGCSVRVLLSGSFDDRPAEPKIYAGILRSLRVPMLETTEVDATQILPRATLIVDALLGVGLRGPIRSSMATLIAEMNRARRPVVSADIPSGLDADTGLPRGTAVVAAATVTFGLPKHGLLIRQGPRHAGRVHVADIGLPRSLTTRFTMPDKP